MNKRGFTLVEMIVVIILIGIVIVVAIPNVVRILKNQEQDKYNAHMKLVDVKLTEYTIKNKGELDSYTSKFRIKYSRLISEKLLEENNGVKCDSYIIMNRKNNDSFSYEKYLKCTNGGDNVYVDEMRVPECGSNCIAID